MLILSEVTRAIRERCQCNFQQIFIEQILPLCENDNPLQVVYRANITTYASYSASQLVAFIEEWMKQGASITSGIYMVMFDSECSVEVSDVDQPICRLSGATCLQSVVRSSLLAGAILLVIFFTMMGIVLMTVVCLIRWRRML